LSISLVYADELTFVVSYGGEGFCNLCGNMSYCLNEYNCWNQGIRYFQDPTPPNSIVTQISISTTSVFWCGSSSNTGYFEINGGIQIDSGFDQPYLCSCDTCPTPITQTREVFSVGYPGYLYQQQNYLQTYLENGVLGIQDLTVTITYTPGGSNYQNASVIIPYVGCGFCNMCGAMNYSLNNGVADCGEGTWDDGMRFFEDPLPMGSMLVQVTVVTNEFFWCGAPVYSIYSLQGVDIAYINVDYSECGCNTCPFPYYGSSSLYPEGFSGYNYGHINSFQIATSVGVVGVRYVEIILTYQSNN